MELEIAKISCARIRQVTDKCRHFLPRKINWKKWKYNYYLFEKFVESNFADPKFYARIYYIIVGYYIISCDNRHFFKRKDVLKEIWKEYRMRFLRNDFKISERGLDTFLYHLGPEKFNIFF